MHEILKQFRQHAIKIKDAGGTLYMVGGAVRDFIQCRKPHDVDFCVTGLTVDQFIELFPEARQQGKQFPVFVIDNCEFAMARTEKKTGVGYNGFEINSNPSVTIEEDLERRDLTINSIAVDVLTGKIVDPCNGLYDISNKILRPSSVAFMEDPVRALRAARFSAQYPDYHVSDTLIYMMMRLKSEIKFITPDHKFSEYKKALCAAKPVNYFKTLMLTNLTEVFPEVFALRGIPQAHHDDGDAFQHTMRVLTECRKITDNPIILNAAVDHDLGKAKTPKEILPAHHDHENRSVEIITEINWVPNDWKSFAKLVAEEHMRGHRFTEMRRGKKVSLIERLIKSNQGLDGFCTVLYADKPTKETMKNIIAMHATCAKIYSISGKDLPESTPRGTVFGQVLHQTRSELLEP